MANIQSYIEELIEALTKLPGVGRKGAERIAYFIIHSDTSTAKDLIASLNNINDELAICDDCGMIFLKKDNECSCSLAANTKHICVVENIADQWSIESTNIFSGYFHILGGTISGTINKSQRLLVDSLVERVKKQNIEEVIVATSATVEGQTTAYYIEETLKNTNVKISKLAQGLPVGGEIESLDDGTLFSAFKNRVQI